MARDLEPPVSLERRDIQNDFTSRHDLVLGEVYGTRGWNIDSLGRLRGVSYPQIMKPGENLATCKSARQPRSHSISSCSCGFYAYFDDAGAPGDYGEIQGVIRAYGQTTIGSKGFRAEKAEIVALALQNDPIRKSTSSRPRPNWFIRALSYIYPSQRALDNFAEFFGFVFLVSGFISLVMSVWGIGSLIFDNGQDAILAAIGLPVVAYLGGLFMLDVNSYLRPGKDKYKSNSKVAKTELRQRRERLQELYPNVKIYDTRSEMFKNHPLSSVSDFVTEPKVPSPSDPDFWEREV